MGGVCSLGLDWGLGGADSSYGFRSWV
jgi:hypothetical protein